MSDATSANTHFIVNARSARASVRRQLEALRVSVARALPESAWTPTDSPGHAVELARAAAAVGARLVVAVGGDGTINEVVNGLLSAAAGAAPTLGILPAGSGSDFVKTLGISRDPAAALRVLTSGHDRLIDAAEIECSPLDARAPAPTRRYFVNIAGCGASGLVVERFNRRNIPGTAGYAVAAGLAALEYRWPLVEVAVDGERPRAVRLNVLFVCNGEYCGGGMRVGRGARLDDGLLQVVEAANVGRVGSLLQWPRLYLGGLERVSGVRVLAGRAVRVTSREDVLVDCDGELCGRLPATYRIVPGALTVRVP